MAAIAHATALVTVITWDWSAGSLQGLTSADFDIGPGGAAAILVLLLLIASSILIISCLILKLDDTHFGPGGVIRWMAAGVLYACMLQGLKRLLPLNRFERDVLQLVLIYLAYWLVFRSAPLARHALRRLTTL